MNNKEIYEYSLLGWTNKELSELYSMSITEIEGIIINRGLNAIDKERIDKVYNHDRFKGKYIISIGGKVIEDGVID